MQLGTASSAYAFEDNLSAMRYAARHYLFSPSPAPPIHPSEEQYIFKQPANQLPLYLFRPTPLNNIAKYQANVTKRGQTKTSSYAEKKVAKKSSANPMLVGCLLLMLCGGAIFEVLRLFESSF